MSSHLTPALSADRPPAILGRWWLHALRTLWLLVVLIIVYTYTVGMPDRLMALVSIIPFGGNWSLLTLQEADLLERWGLPIPAYFWIILLSQLTLALVSLALSMLIVLRQPQNPGAILCAILIASMGCSENSFIEPLADLDWHWRIVNLALQTMATYLGLVIFYTFPDGRFVPGWTRWLTLVYGVCMLAWLFFPAVPFSPLPYGNFSAAPVTTTLIYLGWHATGVAAMVFRYRFHSSVSQRQQMKWAVFGLLLGLAVAISFYIGRWTIRDRLLSDAGDARFFYELASHVGYWLVLVVVVGCFAIAILRHQLWDIDIVIRRTVLYSALSLCLAAVAALSVLVSQTLLRGLSGFDNELTAVLTTLLCVSLFEPLRRRLQQLLDRRYDRTMVDFRPAMLAFGRELNQLHTPGELFAALLERSVALLKVAYGGIYLRDDLGAFRLAYTPEALPDTPAVLDDQALAQLTPDRELHRPAETRWPLLLPLTALRDGEREVIAVLALGPRRSEEPYSRAAIELLLALAERTGSAVSVAELVAHQLSPIGRAETLARRLLREPDGAHDALYQLAHSAFASENEAAVLTALPQALRALAAPALAAAADGFRLLLASRSDHALLVPGLRLIAKATTAQPASAPLQPSKTEPQSIYRLCHDALVTDDLVALHVLLPAIQPYTVAQATNERAPPLREAVVVFWSVLQTLEALPRIGTPGGQLTCLFQAQDQLATIESRLPAALDQIERYVARRVARHWQACVAARIGQIQGQARIELRLVTSSIVRTPEARLGVEVRNLGEGTARKIALQLLPGDGYSPATPEQHLETLGPGDTAVITFALQLHSLTLLRPELQVVFADAAERPTTQTLRLQVAVLAVPAWSSPLANPYIAGVPLRPGSRLFIGRDAEMAAITRMLLRPTPSAIVCTGQRRMGKTSLLQQLGPALAEGYVPVFFDSQLLGLDPGLPQLCAALGGRIARAARLEPPPVTQFAASPIATFGEQFLPAALEATGAKRLLLLIDEVEALEGADPTGAFLGLLRHLMQHEPRVAVILAGAHRLEALRPVHWTGIFNAALHQRLVGLNATDARALITRPLGEAVMFDELAIDQIIRLTGGHPYFLQLLCQTLVDQANDHREAVILLDHVLAVRLKVLELGEAPLADLWHDSTADERLVLTALSRLLPHRAAIDAQRLAAALAEQGLAVEATRLDAALQRLAWRDLLLVDEDHDLAETQRYRWRVTMFRNWVLRTQTLSPAAARGQGDGGADDSTN